MRFNIASIILTTLCAYGFSGTSQQKEMENNTHDKLRNPITLYETFDNEGVNLGVRGDVLYMVYNPPVLTYASKQTTSSQTLYSHILNVPGKLSVGCDIALLYTMPHSPGYSFEAGWYHIVAQFSDKQTANNIVPAHSVALRVAAPGNASVSGHMNINFFDLLIKKQFAFGDWFTLAPAAGLIGGYMNGISNADFNATSDAFSRTSATTGSIASTTASLSYTNRFKGIGVRIGGMSAFKICCGLRLQAELFYSVLYGLGKTQLNYAQNGLYAGVSNASVSNYAQHFACPFFDSLLSLAWEKQFSDDAFAIDLHAGWKFQTFSNGWYEFEAEFNDAVRTLPLHGQGLQAGVTFRF